MAPGSTFDPQFMLRLKRHRPSTVVHAKNELFALLWLLINRDAAMVAVVKVNAVPLKNDPDFVPRSQDLDIIHLL
ncbi:unnamed protein product [Taenia asiatica]|uniref:Uncharacterized protein n=1 Tax=Taenia asiatica TaxID=60517 RepID=A0A0R3W326_TAEAS|nr:unnamed protein product [Taenia asiatica]